MKKEKWVSIRLIIVTMMVAGSAATWPQLARAQATTAQITGRITDASRAVLPGVSIVVTNVETGIKRGTTSNDEGYYTIPLLPPGGYRMDLEIPGFSPIARSGITLAVNQTARIDFEMQVGEVTETVSVEAAAPLLDAAEGSLGTVVDNSKIINLPLSGRNPFDLVLLTPGTHVYGRPDFPGNNIPLTNFSTNGGPSMTNEILLDGIPNTAAGRQNEFIITPSVDAVQEFKVQSNSIKAEFGRTGGGVVNLSLKSGTNQFHGTLFEFLRNDKFDANSWFNNRSGQQKPPFRFNQFGGSVGGPISKERTFFFANYEGLRRRRGKTFLFTVPREDMRRGDFSKVQTASGQPVQIFDPLTTRTVAGGGRTRDPFPNNVIPQNRMDPAALKMLEFWPKPKLPGDPRTGANNFISTDPEKFHTNLVNIRIDHRLGQNHHLFVRFSWDEHEVTPPNVFRNMANPASGPQLFTHRNVGVHDTWTVNSSTIATFRLGYARLRDSSTPLSDGLDVTEIGFSPRFASQQPGKVFPNIQVTGMTISNIGFGTSSLGPVGTFIENAWPNLYSGQTDLTKIRGKHVFKVGADARVYRIDGFQKNNVGGAFSFTPAFTQGPDPTRGGPAFGHAFASYLLGTGSGSMTLEPSKDEQSYYIGLYVQDDIKVTPELTLNLGVRYEAESCLTERYDKLTFLDFKSPSPVQAPALGRTVVGGVGFVGVGGNPRTVCDLPKNNWGPRFGFAYNWNSRFVIRGGYGILHVPANRAGVGQRVGYSASTPWVSSIDGFTPISFLNDPFSGGVVPPTGNSLGLLTAVGGGVSSVDRDQRLPYVQQWNIGVQHALPGDTVVEVAYAGSKGTHLDGNLQWNQIPDQFLSQGNRLLERVPNPFFGNIPENQPLGRSTVIAGQLLRPFPHFTSFLTPRSTAGSSIYHSM